MGVTIRVSEDSLSSDLAMMPEDVYNAEITQISTKTSKASGQPVSWVVWTITSDASEPIDEDLYPDLQGSTVGKKVIESYSLQEQAIWRLNTLFKTVTDENLPTDQDYSLDDFNAMLKDHLTGFEGVLQLQQEEDNKGNPKMTVATVTAIQRKKKRGKK